MLKAGGQRALKPGPSGTLRILGPNGLNPGSTSNPSSLTQGEKKQSQHQQQGQKKGDQKQRKKNERKEGQDGPRGNKKHPKEKQDPSQVQVDEKPAPKTGRLDVVVSDVNRRPVGDAQVTVTTEDGGVVAQGRTDEQGRFTIDLPQGSYRVRVSKENHRAPPQSQQQDQAVVVIGDGGGRAERTLHGIGRLRISIVEALHNPPRPLPDANLAMTGVMNRQGPSSTGQVEVNEVPAGSYTLTATRNGALERAEATAIQVSAGQTTDVTLSLSFEKILIVGEGTTFGYATDLARRTTGDATRPRRWVIPSQYDVTPGGELGNNALIYRDAQNEGGRFDCTDQGCWDRVGAEHGDFRAIVFNNPHAGHALPKYTVIGVLQHIVRNGHEQAKTISEAEYDTFDDIIDFSSGAPVTLHKSQVFTWSRARHRYVATRSTMGLNEFLLRKYAEYGKEHLLPGGTLEINGPPWVGDYLRPLGFTNAGPFTGSPYYAHYVSNLTDEVPHPSWGDGPRAHSNADNMTRWIWTKP